jgi:hypothetical protein
MTVRSMSHLGTSINALLDTLAELHRHGVRVVIHDHAGDGAAVETAGLMAAADLLVDARRRYRAEGIRGRPNSVQGLWHWVWTPACASIRLALPSGQGGCQRERPDEWADRREAKHELTAGNGLCSSAVGWHIGDVGQSGQEHVSVGGGCCRARF